MQPASSNLPDDLQLYLALVGLLREEGLACASMQVDSRPHRECDSAIEVTGTPQARSLLSPRIEREIGLRLDPGEDRWTLTLDEAWKLIDCCAVV
jgi:hypothetical protein